MVPPLRRGDEGNHKGCPYSGYLGSPTLEERPLWSPWIAAYAAMTSAGAR